MRNRTENQINMVLIRHGMTISNEMKRYLGKGDEALSEAGKEGLILKNDKGSYPGSDYLYTSPMKRCLQTADLLYPELTPKVIGEWGEIDFGRFEGKSFQELSGDKVYREWIESNGVLAFPEGESREAFICRCCVGMNRMLRELEAIMKEDISPIKPVPAVACILHGGSIMALLSSYGAGDYFDYQCGNGAGYLCRLRWMDSMKPDIEILRKL